MELIEIAEELYSLSPGEFTTARNERAKALKSEDKELAKRVQQLRKPSSAAWVVNMLMRHNGDEMANVLALGDSLRKAQADLDGDALRELTRQRRQLIAAVTSKGRGLAFELGEKVSESVARQVEDTLHAAMIDENAAAAVRSGLLTESLAATGLGSLDIEEAVADSTALGRTASRAKRPERKRADLSVVPEEESDEAERRAEALAAAQARVEEAATAADEARAKLGKADRRLSKLQAKALQVQGRLDELRRKLVELEHEAETVDDEIEAAEEKRARAVLRHEEASAAEQSARAQLAELD